MTVVKRCPSCGTTQASAGECEACHEAHVRYFCTNHEPGVWLDGRTCPQCEARAALAARPASAVASRARPAALRADAGASDEDRDLRPSRQALWEKLIGGAMVPRPAPPPVEAAPEREPAPLGHERGWLTQLAIRLALIALVLVVALGLAVYVLARSL